MFSVLYQEMNSHHKAILEREEENRYLQTLIDLGRTINSTQTIQEVLSLMLDMIIKLSDAERGFLMIKDEENQLSISIGRNLEKEILDTPDAILSRTIVNRVIKEGKPILTNNASEDARFEEVESISNYKLRSILCVPIKLREKVTGVIYIDSNIQHGSFTDKNGVLLTALADQAALAIEKTGLYKQLQSSTLDLTKDFDSIIGGWANALELRDFETEGHSQRVVSLSRCLAQSFGMTDQELLHLERGVILHDIGKIAISDSILLKPGPLSEKEWEIIRQHPDLGFRLLNQVNLLKSALPIVRFHHEKWDGSGYPLGLMGEKIPLGARIFSVVDVWDSLIHARPYKKAWSHEEALFYLQSQTGDYFDASVVQEFTNIITKM